MHQQWAQGESPKGTNLTSQGTCYAFQGRDCSRESSHTPPSVTEKECTDASVCHSGGGLRLSRANLGPVSCSPWGPGNPQGAAHLPAGSSCVIAAEYLSAASANCPFLNSSLPWLFRPAGPTGAEVAGGGAPGPGEALAATGSSGPFPPPGCPLAPPAVAGARGRPRFSALNPGARLRRCAPLSGLLPPSFLPVSFFWMLPMVRGCAVLAGPAGSAASVGSGCGK